MTTNKEMETEIEGLIIESLEALGREDLFRRPLVAFSSAMDERYMQLKETIGHWHLTPVELLPEAESVISYFVPFTKAVAMEPKTVEHGSFMWSQSYQ